MKGFLVMLIFLMAASFVVAQEAPDIGFDGEDAEKLQGLIENYTPLSESGEVDFEKYKPFVTKAEMRIAAINLWLDENVGWMRYIFHMKPIISWLFFINVYVILWFFVVLFLNSEGLWFFIEKKGGARVFGLGVFLILLVTRLYYGLATVLYAWASYLWIVFIEASIWFAIIAIILLVVLMIVSFPVVIAIFSALARYRGAKEEMKRKMEMKTSIESVEALVSQIGKK